VPAIAAAIARHTCSLAYTAGCPGYPATGERGLTLRDKLRSLCSWIRRTDIPNQPGNLPPHPFVHYGEGSIALKC
jgi:hypothetical protein